MNSIKVLDVTLRDGGCINDFNFGQTYMEKILSAQESSGVDIIEMGYIDEKKGSPFGRSQFCNEKVIQGCLLKHKKPGVTYVAMVDYGQFNIENFGLREKDGIDGIRLAFHKKDCHDVISLFKKLHEKGYEIYIQPMITMRYSDQELLDLIELVNAELPYANSFYMVDSFGEMRPNDLNRILNLVDHNLRPGMTIGYHSHNNLQMSYSNAMSLLQFPSNRDIIVDCSIMGMGKGAGNLNTELLLEHLNMFYGKHYNLSPLLEVIDKVINQLHSEYYWGYSPEYYLSSVNHCTPSYAGHFYNKHMLPIDQVAELLSMIDDRKKISFDKEYAEELWRKYNEQKTVDDSAVIAEMKSALAGKNVLLVAPGKSIIEYRDVVNKYINNHNVVSIGLNLTEDFGVDYLVTTRQDVLELASEKKIPVITTSNLSKGARGNVKIFNYKNWIEVDDRTHDSSSVIAMNILKVCGVKEIYLAGFDGFDVNINNNYFDPNMRRPVSVEQAVRRNAYYKDFIHRVADTGTKVTFITPSLYE
jgi:4-hydroxy 2-oxovalerate aldolase